MAINVKKIYFDTKTNGLIDSSNNKIANEQDWPSIFFGEEGAVINVQFVKNQDATDKYTDLPSTATSQAIVDLDFSNPVEYNLVKDDEDNWTVSGVAGEYNSNETVSAEPFQVLINSVVATQGTVGSLTAGTWGYSSSTLTVRLSDDTDPNTKASGYVTYIPEYTPVYIQSLADKFNQALTWDDAGSFRNPVLENGEVTFQLYADTDDFAERIGTSSEASNTTMQIQFFEAVTANLFQVYEFKFRCRNRYLPNTFTPNATMSSYYTKTETIAAFVGKSLFDANTIIAADTDDTPAAVTIAEQTVLGRITGGNIKALSQSELNTLIGSGTFISKTLFDANTILAATTDDTPAALTVPVQTLVGRITAGDIDALTPTEVRTLINVADGADVTGSNAPQAHTTSHTDGTDDIQNASTSVKGLLTAALWDKLDGIETAADVTDSGNVETAGAVMDSDISETEGFLRKTGVGTYEAIKSNLASAVTPTINEDSGDGYAVGSQWLDTTADKAYVLLDSTVGAAVWIETTSINAGDMLISTYDGVGVSEQLVGLTASQTLTTKTLTSPVINVTSDAHGDVYFRDTSGAFARLAPGTSGKFLKTQGAAADPVWDTPAGAGDCLSNATTTDNSIARYDGTDNKTIQGSGIIVDDSDNVTGMLSLNLKGDYESIYIDAGAMVSCTTNGASAGTNDIDWDYFAFDGEATEERIRFKMNMPDSWDLGTVKCKLYWSSATGSTIGDTVEWGVKAGALSDDDAIDAALGTAQVISDALLGTSGSDLQVTAATPAITIGGTPALGDLVTFEVYRNTDGTDDMVEDAWLVGIAIQYKKLSTAVAGW